MSWLLRLAKRLDVSLDVLTQEAFGVESQAKDLHAWCRPDRWSLNRISSRTGMPVEQLRHMTLEKWMLGYRDDESNERFYGPRYDTRPPHRRQRRFVVCGQCLREDSVPYLRRSWLIGWTAICPRHQCLLTTHCGACRRKLSGEITAFGRPFAIGCCSMCGSKLSEVPVDVVPAHPTVQRLHDVLLHGKKEGFTVIAGIGRFTWQEVVALSDVILGTFWTNPITDIYAHDIFLRQVFLDFDCKDTDDAYANTRYRSLVFLAWMLDGWPDSYNAGVAKDLLRQWSMAKHTRISRHLGGDDGGPWDPVQHQIEPAIQSRLRQLADR